MINNTSMTDRELIRLKKSLKRLSKYIAGHRNPEDVFWFYFLEPHKTRKEEMEQNQSSLMEKIDPRFKKKIGYTVTVVFEDEDGGLWQNNFFI